MDVRPELRAAYTTWRARAMDNKRGIARIEVGAPGQPKITVLHFHGAGEPPDCILTWRLAEAFERRGEPIRVLALDYGNPREVERILDQLPGRVVAMGHSAGGGFAMDLARRRADKIGAVIGLASTGASADVDTLLIHGTDDDAISIEHARQARRANPERITLVEMPGCDHSLRARTLEENARGVTRAEANATTASAQLLDRVVDHIFRFIQGRAPAFSELG